MLNVKQKEYKGVKMKTSQWIKNNKDLAKMWKESKTLKCSICEKAVNPDRCTWNDDCTECVCEDCGTHYID